MDDFRSELAAVIESMRESGVDPVFLMIELGGIDVIRRTHGSESVEKFRSAALDALSSAAAGCDTFRYGDQRIVGILPGFDRLKTFALIERLRRALPYLGQSFDCVLAPAFDVVEYDDATGVPGLVSQLMAAAKPRDAA